MTQPLHPPRRDASTFRKGDVILFVQQMHVIEGNLGIQSLLRLLNQCRSLLHYLIFRDTKMKVEGV